MNSEKLEYDSAVGGKITLPDYLHTYHYAGQHVEEIKSLLKNIQNPSNTKLAFQTLPKHMRRRAMSHYPKRLPRRYRNIHKSQMMKAGNPQPTKRPSRKYRRKPSNLMKEYIRRQRKNAWLETHIWHAKRFHMINRWGYKLPFASCDKTYRACYRASARHCLLQDISFYDCIEISGSIEEIKSGFCHLTSNKCGLSITAKTYINGKREGFIDLFKMDQYPRCALGKVSFIWKSFDTKSTDDTRRTVWIFMHPSMYNEVLHELINVFQLISTRTTKTPLISEAEGNSNEDEKFSVTTKTYVRNPEYINNEKSIKLLELKGTLNRFRLTGALSQSVLCNAFKCKQITEKNQTNDWFNEYLQSEVASNAHKLQCNYWEKYSKINSPSRLIPNIVLGLNIEDPRINRPKKRTKAITEEEDESVDESIFHELPENLCYSAIWNYETRNRITENMLSHSEYCKLRNKNAIVPGERCMFEDKLQPIPILLIQRPGSQISSYKRLGYGEGWDVIIPSGYGLPVWLSLIVYGAKAGGLRELASVARESGQDQFLPDTVSGRKIQAEQYIELRDKYFRRPPNKRCNYNKIAISSPFRAPFQQLVNEWKTNKNDSNQKYLNFFVLREKQTLNNVIMTLKNKANLPQISEECLIQISFKMKTRGNPGNFSIICLPSKNDLKRYYKQKYHKDNNPVYIEPLTEDKNEGERKFIRIRHKKILKRLRSRRVREKRKAQETSEIAVRIRPAQTKDIVSDHFKKMCELWIKENPNTIRQQCTREVFGYITESQFSYTEATFSGVGYIVINGLIKLLKICGKGEKLLLIRGTKTRNYRFASFKINPMMIS